MIKIALDARLYRGSMTGDSTYWTGLVDALIAAAPADVQFRFYGMAPAPGGTPVEIQKLWEVLPARSSRTWSYFKFPLAALRWGADRIHTQYSLSPFTVGRGITTVHDVSFLIEPSWFPVRDRAILSRTVPAAVQRAASVITVSATSQREIEQFIPAARGKTHAIWNGPNSLLEAVTPDEAEKIVRDELGIRGRYALSVSTVWPRKNMGLVVAAVGGLPDDSDLQLVLTGKFGWGERPEHPRVHRTGYVPPRQLSALYSLATLTLCPSLHEGFGLPVIEAFGAGCPVIVGPGGALPEIAGEAGVVLPDHDAATWTGAIQDLLADSSKLARLRARGLKRVDAFSWAASAERHLNVYREAK